MKISLVLLALAFTTTSLLAEPPALQTDLRKTLTAASKDNKMGFILLGRPACGNCNATKKMVSEGKINVSAAEFVMADLNVDDEKTNAEFMRKYGKEKWGDMLPFIVVTDSRGKALANSSGYRKADDWNKLLTEAKTKAGGKTSPPKR
jgi:thioredoxin-related protein